MIVPLLEEFQHNRVLPSAPTVEARIKRMLTEGLLPIVSGCCRCGDAMTRRVVHVVIDCERSRGQHSGGMKILILPLIVAFHVSIWHEEERVQQFGNDIDVATPVCLCEECHQQYPPLRSAPFLVGLLGLLALSAIVALVSLVAGIALGVVSVVVLGYLKTVARKRRQEALKALLRSVPAYTHLLMKYPHATVSLPPYAPER